MKRILFIVIVFLTIVSCKKEDSSNLTIYSYSSMNWMNTKVIPLFEKMNNCKVELDTSFNDTGDLISKVILQKKSPKADIIFGITPSNIQKLLDEEILKSYKPQNIEKISNSDLLFNKDFYVTPFDYGAIAILYNPEFIEEPKSFEDLWKYDKKLIIEDPRTSSTGLDFLLWTIGLYNDDWKTQWGNLKRGVLTATSGWSEAFAKFEANEAPMMVSYATDPAYSYEYYKSVKYKVFIPKEGGYVQIEGAGITKKSKNFNLASKFIDFMLTDDFQKEIPLNQWMFPVTEAPLPESFKYAVTPQKIVKVNPEIYTKINGCLEEWEEIFTGK